MERNCSVRQVKDFNFILFSYGFDIFFKILILYSILDTMILSKKPSHATVPSMLTTYRWKSVRGVVLRDYEVFLSKK
jgi:hypothetical protein